MDPLILLAMTASEGTVTAVVTCVLAVIALVGTAINLYFSNEKLKIDNQAILDGIQAQKHVNEATAKASSEAIRDVGDKVKEVEIKVDGRVSEILRLAQENSLKDVKIAHQAGMDEERGSAKVNASTVHGQIQKLILSHEALLRMLSPEQQELFESQRIDRLKADNERIAAALALGAGIHAAIIPVAPLVPKEVEPEEQVDPPRKPKRATGRPHLHED